jgi:hypothetical protein
MVPAAFVNALSACLSLPSRISNLPSAKLPTHSARYFLVLGESDRDVQYGDTLLKAPGCRENFTPHALRSRFVLRCVGFARKLERFGSKAPGLVVTTTGLCQRTPGVKKGDMPSPAANLICLEQGPCAEEEFFCAGVISSFEMDQAGLQQRMPAGLGSD